MEAAKETKFGIKVAWGMRMMPELCTVRTSVSHLSSRWNWKKTAASRWTCCGVRVSRTLDYPTINLNPR